MQRKALVVAGIVLTIPLALISGFLVADPFYMRFIFEGDRKDFAPGDSLGVLFYALLFAILILVAAAPIWIRICRNVWN